MNTGQVPRAILEFKSALEIDRDAPEARNQLAAAYESNARIDQERRNTTALSSSIQNTIRHIWTLAPSCTRTVAFRKPRRMTHVRWSLHLPTGGQSQPGGRLRGPGAVCSGGIRADEGIDLSPNAFLYNNLAWIYILQERFEDAIQTMKQAVEYPEADSITWSTFARACRWAGGHEQETAVAYRETLRRADEEVRVNPFDIEARANRAFLLAE